MVRRKAQDKVVWKIIDPTPAQFSSSFGDILYDTHDSCAVMTFYPGHAMQLPSGMLAVFPRHNSPGRIRISGPLKIPSNSCNCFNRLKMGLSPSDGEPLLTIASLVFVLKPF